MCIFIYLYVCFYLKTHHTTHWGNSKGKPKTVPFLKALVADHGLEPRLFLLTHLFLQEAQLCVLSRFFFNLNDLYCAPQLSFFIPFIPWHCNHIGFTAKYHELILLLSTPKDMLLYMSPPTPCFINLTICLNFFASLWSHHPFKVWQGNEWNMCPLYSG